MKPQTWLTNTPLSPPSHKLEVPPLGLIVNRPQIGHLLGSKYELSLSNTSMKPEAWMATQWTQNMILVYMLEIYSHNMALIRLRI